MDSLDWVVYSLYIDLNKSLVWLIVRLGWLIRLRDLNGWLTLFDWLVGLLVGLVVIEWLFAWLIDLLIWIVDWVAWLRDCWFDWLHDCVVGCLIGLVGFLSGSFVRLMFWFFHGCIDDWLCDLFDSLTWLIGWFRRMTSLIIWKSNRFDWLIG